MYRRTTHPSQMTAQDRDAARRAAAPKGSTFYRAKDGSCLIAVAAFTRGNGRSVQEVKAWQGKSLKPFYHYLVEPQKLAATIDRLFKSVADTAQRRADARATNRPCNRGLQVGTILRSSWGYDQTNVNFYRVTALVGASMVELVELPYIEVGQGKGSGWSGKCVPDIDAEGTPVGRFQVRRGSVRIDSCQVASIWEGRPQYWSSYA